MRLVLLLLLFLVTLPCACFSLGSSLERDSSSEFSKLLLPKQLLPKQLLDKRQLHPRSTALGKSAKNGNYPGNSTSYAHHCNLVAAVNPLEAVRSSMKFSIDSLRNVLPDHKVMNDTLVAVELASLSVLNSAAAAYSNSTLLPKAMAMLVSPKSAEALTSIINTLKNDPATAPIRATIRAHSPKVLIGGFLAMSKLQDLVPPPASAPGPTLDAASPLAQDIVHYSLYATAAYGWKSDLFSRFRVHLGDLAAFLHKTGLPRADVLAHSFEARTHRPAYLLARDQRKKTIVLTVRGTLSMHDVLTDMCFDEASFTQDDSSYVRSMFGHSNRAHRGMVEAAMLLNDETKELVAAALAANSGYKLVITGHSLGAGVAAILGTKWAETFKGVKVYCYGSPCIAPVRCKPTNNRDIVSVLNCKDLFSTLSLGHISDAFMAVKCLCEDAGARARILDIWERKRGEMAGGEKVDAGDMKWARTQAKLLRSKMEGGGTSRHYPPGLLYMIEEGGGGGGGVVLRSVPTEFFGESQLNRDMFDLGPHLPGVYEILLERFAEEKKDEET
jgi:sn1-specific diacylglycerol lipase